jgi:hypothetical protein
MFAISRTVHYFRYVGDRAPMKITSILCRPNKIPMTIHVKILSDGEMPVDGFVYNKIAGIFRSRQVYRNIGFEYKRCYSDGKFKEKLLDLCRKQLRDYDVEIHDVVIEHHLKIDN